MKNRVSFVFPVYNEEYIIEKTLLSYHKEFDGKLEFDMIVAEDGSTDKTKEILKIVASKIPVKLHMHNERKGYLRAIKDALNHAENEWIFLVDSDHQFNPGDFWKLWPFRESHDLILGIKKNRKDGPLRLFLSKGYNILLKYIFWVPYEDMDTGFRLFKRDMTRKIAPSVNNLGFFTAEFVIKAHDLGYKIKQIPVEHLNQKIRASNIFHIKKLPFILSKEFKGIFKLFKEIRIKKNLDIYKEHASKN